jgi:hypothetical protein
MARFSSRSLLDQSWQQLLQLAHDFTWLNPHLSLKVGESEIAATDTAWRKWRPNQPTSPHWYDRERLERLIGAYLVHDQDNGRERTVREFIAEFDGLTSTVKQKAVLELTGLGRTKLAALHDGARLNGAKVFGLLHAMKTYTKPVKPPALGIIGKDHLAARFEAEGCAMASFRYKRKLELDSRGVPTVVETAFAYRPAGGPRRLITGVNWSPGITTPFRALGRYGRSLDAALGDMFAGTNDPIVMLIHLACPRVEYADRGKSAITLED